MIPARLLGRPTARFMEGAAGRYTTYPNRLRNESLITLKDHVYFARATAEGAGRKGSVRSNGDAPLELKMSMPKATGGKGDGQNPEQLFAMGYASCFLGALQLAASRANKLDIAEKAKVNTRVFLGHPKDPNLDGFGLRVEVNVEGCEDDTIIQAAHEFCPYSRALKHGIEVDITKS